MGVIRNATNRALVNLAFLLLVLITSPALVVASVFFSLTSSVNAASVSGTIVIEAEGGAVLSAPVPDTYEFSGAAMHAIPIEIVPGRNGIQPNLNLTYNSYQKNGWLGVGWDIDMGSIQRSTKFGVCYDCDDYVANKSGSSSVLVSRIDWGPDYYGAKIEGGFSKYFKNPAGGWIVAQESAVRF